MSDSYTEKELNAEVTVRLSLRDLIILEWGSEAVSWSDPESEAVWNAASEKLCEAKTKLEAKLLLESRHK